MQPFESISEDLSVDVEIGLTRNSLRKAEKVVGENYFRIELDVPIIKEVNDYNDLTLICYVSL